MTLLWDVIRLAPNMPEAYYTLGALHENANDPRKAINFYIIAAHLDPKVGHYQDLEKRLWAGVVLCLCCAGQISFMITGFDRADCGNCIARFKHAFQAMQGIHSSFKRKLTAKCMSAKLLIATGSKIQRLSTQSLPIGATLLTS